MVWPSLLGVADLGPLSEDSSRTKLLCDFGRVSLLGNELVARAWLDADYSRDPETGDALSVLDSFQPRTLTRSESAKRRARETLFRVE